MKSKKKDIVGNKYNRWTVLSKDCVKNKLRYYLCECECGTVRKVEKRNLVNGLSKSCGCYKHDVLFRDITGQKFGKLTAIRVTDQKRHKASVWEFKCDCGKTTIIPGNWVLSGSTSSCGCAMRDHTRGENCNLWRGGVFDRKYVGFVDTLKEKIRARDGYRCQQCFAHQNDLHYKNGKNYKLSVHHIDFDKKNSNPDNLISLCRVCHSQTNFDRNKWIKYFKNKMYEKKSALCIASS